MRPPPDPVAVTWEQYATAWSRLHGGFDPSVASPLVRGGWRPAYRGGTLLVRLRVGPAAVTAAGPRWHERHRHGDRGGAAHPRVRRGQRPGGRRDRGPRARRLGHDGRRGRGGGVARSLRHRLRPI